MSVQVLDGSLASNNGLNKEAEHGEHGQAAVLDLLHPQLSKGVWIVSQAQGVEVVATYRRKTDQQGSVQGAGRQASSQPQRAPVIHYHPE